MNKKVYISGGMSGIKDLNFGAFKKVEEKLKEIGLECVNPHTVGESIENSIPSDSTVKERYNSYMIADIKELMTCNCVYLLRGWKKSRGANMEKNIAVFFGMEIVYQKTKMQLFFRSIKYLLIGSKNVLISKEAVNMSLNISESQFMESL